MEQQRNNNAAMTQQAFIPQHDAYLTHAFRTEDGNWLGFMWHDSNGNTRNEAIWIGDQHE
jgi:hypothetical protein